MLFEYERLSDGATLVRDIPSGEHVGEIRWLRGAQGKGFWQYAKGRPLTAAELRELADFLER